MNLEAVFNKVDLPIDRRLQAKNFVERKQLRELFESLLIGLLYNRPSDPIDFMKHCLYIAKDFGNAPIKPTTFMIWDAAKEDATGDKWGPASEVGVVHEEGLYPFTVFNR